MTCAIAAAMLTLTAGCACFRSAPAYQPGYLTLSPGQTYQAKQAETWASLAIVREKDSQILLLQEAVRKLLAREALGTTKNP